MSSLYKPRTGPGYYLATKNLGVFEGPALVPATKWKHQVVPGGTEFMVTETETDDVGGFFWGKLADGVPGGPGWVRLTWYGDLWAKELDGPTPEKEAAPKKAAKAKKGGGGGDAAPAKPAAAAAGSSEEDAKKKLKKVIKEGGKRGVEIEGAADMGGLRFFSTSVDEPDGDLDMLMESMKAMNNQPDPGDEERKGCSGHIGKTIFSAGTEQLAIVSYVPEAEQDNLSCKEWLQAVLANFGGEVVSESKTMCAGRVKADGNKNVFPLKIREPMILEANNFLRKKGLFPEDNSDDDEMVFGDDDFPS